MTSRFKDHILGPDIHANLPATTAAPEGALYECTTHGRIYRNTAGSWITWAQIVPPGGSTAQVLGKNSATDGDVSWISGGGGSSIKDERWQSPSGATSVDEFNDASLDAAWVRVDGANAPAANVTWAEGGDTLSAKQTAVDTGNAFHALLRPLSGMGGALAIGDGISTSLRIFGKRGESFCISGLVLADGDTYGSGTQVLTESYYDASSAANYNNSTGGYTNFTASGAGTGGGVFQMTIGGPTFQRLVYLGSNQWRGDRSPDGVQWINGTVLTLAFTPTYAGLYTRKPGTGNPHITTFEFLRRVSGVT